ncbi:hypothetical protein BDN72DRAFT_868984 [Pluteus cervinus]|uniref:Uncharacterized protein n=1 Tax=Pluteus cervinus TaxID=181527 RepID=A0ACD3B639_9AGAR|nr:hypothetical protein BDN72DRAFT_868984 [Pluteus cervinus]
MPVASSSRRKSGIRRRLDSDIEEDEPTQPQTNGREGGKKSRKLTKGRSRDQPDMDNEGGGDEDDDEVIDVDNFENQPLSRSDLTKIKGFSSDWNHMAQKIRQSWPVVSEVAVGMADSAEGQELEKGLSDLETIMRDLIDVDAEMVAHSKTMDDLHQKIAQGSEVSDAVEYYADGIKMHKMEYKGKTARQKYAKSDGYLKFKQGIYEVQHPGSAMPPVTEMLPKEDGDVSDDDDDLEVGGVTQSYTCPITLTPLVDPLTSSVCGHSFSAEAIRQVFRSGHPVKKCPASGCNKSFSLSDCRPDKDLAKKVKAWQRRAQRMEEDTDAEEVVD